MANQPFRSLCPASGELVWEGAADTADQVCGKVDAARRAAGRWADTPLADRIAVSRAYGALLDTHHAELAETIARETGKPLWEARQEVQSMVGKVELSIRAQAERAGAREDAAAFGHARLRHRPHGVMAVLGPYNFPGHLPNGHIVPALLAGNAVVFKPSEETPATGEVMARLWREAGLPEGVLIVAQGGRDTGAALVGADIDGLLFTGSAATGLALRRAMVDRPHVILALELGGNNPLIAWDGDPLAVASIIVQSAFATTGQRCSCARRLILPDGLFAGEVVEAVAALAGRMRIGQWNEQPEPALGPLVSIAAARQARQKVDLLREAGAREILALGSVADRSEAFVTPAILDVTGCDVPDEEIFAPLLQVIRVADFEAAIRVANDTTFGLAAGLVSADADLWRSFLLRSRAGVVNWNRPTTGASGALPFGGLGASGNHRPSGYYAADYCAYPVASFEQQAPSDLSAEIRGLAPFASLSRP
ncbi:MAG: succinylglutamate-semialdehyde dehydrogenase [Sphingomonas sp.]